MFQNMKCVEFDFFDGNVKKGLIKMNKEFDLSKKTIRPFIRTKSGVVLSSGRINYNLLDTFIINSMNDYYQKLDTFKDKNEALRNYNDLYNLWNYINVLRSNNDVNVAGYYDDLVYRLYILGYKI